MKPTTHLTGLLIAMALCSALPALSGCHRWSVADLETQPATVRVDGVAATPATITEDGAMGVPAEGADAVLAVFSRGDRVEYVGDNGAGLAMIRLTSGEGEEAVQCVAYVEARFLRLDAESEPEAYTVFALTDARAYADFALTADERVLLTDTALTVVDELDGVLVALEAADATQASGSALYLSPDMVASAPATLTSRVDGLEVLAGYLARGDRVTVLGTAGAYAVVRFSNDGATSFAAFVPAWLVRADGEAAPEGRSGYATYNAAVWPTAFLAGDGAVSVAVDTEITVHDEFGGVAYVTTADGVSGYMASNQVTETKNYRPSTGRPSSRGASSGGQDGGDISLSAYPAAELAGTLRPARWVAGTAADDATVVTETPDAALTEATVLSDGTPVIWALLDRGEAIHVRAADADTLAPEGCIAVQLAGRAGWVDEWLIRLAGDPAFAPLDRYAQEGAAVYADRAMTQVVETLHRNDIVHAVDEFGEGFAGYVLEVETPDGTVFRYIPKDKVSETEIPAPVVTVRPSGGGSSGPQWTDPVL